MNETTTLTPSAEDVETYQAAIEQYLADGDKAFESGDYQAAIDLWSRIFLIDVTNDEASQRIEKAKARRREAWTGTPRRSGETASNGSTRNAGDGDSGRRRLARERHSDSGSGFGPRWAFHAQELVGAAGFEPTTTSPPD